MFSFSVPELSLILVIALVVFGPGKLPEVGKAIGKGMREFRQAIDTSSLEDGNIEASKKNAEQAGVEMKKEGK
jgi:sec-independent protein translocase protein TatA